MSFYINANTINDLEIIESKSGRSLLTLLDNTVTYGGREVLKDVLLFPFDDIGKIQAQQNMIKGLMRLMPIIPFTRNEADLIEHYLDRTKLKPTNSAFQAVKRGLKAKLLGSNDLYIIETGCYFILRLLSQLQKWSVSTELEETDLIKEFRINVIECIESGDEYKLQMFKSSEHLTFKQVCLCDYYFREKYKGPIKFALSLLYTIDAFNSVAMVSKQNNYTFPSFIESPSIYFEGLYHPFLQQAVPNDLKLISDQNVLVLTGANMAGKSTFMKSIGLAVYQAHLGFPVAAKELKIKALNGLSLTMNISDDLSKGYSHFYSEVIQLRNVAELVKSETGILFLFDELFKGTNYQDAFDGLSLILNSFVKNQEHFFIVSTHLFELAEELQQTNARIAFSCFETTMNNGTPYYTYKLYPGVSTNRLGLTILLNEGIMNLLNHNEQSALSS